jgi:tetratricopeptide (TPR) repeat protein
MAVLQIFLSHAEKDMDEAMRVAAELRNADANVWYDEHNSGAEQYLGEFQRQLASRPVLIVLLSPNAFASDQVRRECKRAFNIRMRDPSHIILPLVIAKIEPRAFNTMPYLKDYKRVSLGGDNPLPHDHMIAETLRLLALAPVSQTLKVTESADDLIIQGRALAAQKRWEEALLAFQWATEWEPGNASAWGETGRMLNKLKRYAEALSAHIRSLELNEQQAWVWNNKGLTLYALNHEHRPSVADVDVGEDEDLLAFERAIAVDPDFAPAWNNKGNALIERWRSEEAIAAYDRAIALDPNDAEAWNSKGFALIDLERSEEAIAAYDCLIALGSYNALAWSNKGAVLDGLGRYDEAIVAYDHAIAYDSKFAFAWLNKGMTLDNMGRHDQAITAYKRHAAIDPDHTLICGKGPIIIGSLGTATDSE